MSFYATLQGTITAPNKEVFLAAVQKVKEDGWIDEKGRLLNERNQPVGRCVSGNKFIIPYGYHRNIFSLIKTLEEMGFTSEYKGYSTDGVFKGYLNKKTIDLSSWAKKHYSRPQPDEDDNTKSYRDWQEDVVDFFWDKHRD